MGIIILSALADETEELQSKYKVILTGVGKVNAAIASSKAIQNHNPDLIINYGSAGSTKKNISGLVDCKYFIQRDMDSRSLGFELGQTPYENYPSKIIKASNHPANTINMNLTCATGDSFVTSDLDLDTDIIDMEAYSIAKICCLEKIPFLCFKYISDVADENASRDFNQHVKNGGILFSDYLESVSRYL